jgi:hypothetical protein
MKFSRKKFIQVANFLFDIFDNDVFDRDGDNYEGTLIIDLNSLEGMQKESCDLFMEDEDVFLELLSENGFNYDSEPCDDEGEFLCYSIEISHRRIYKNVGVVGLIANGMSTKTGNTIILNSDGQEYMVTVRDIEGSDKKYQDFETLGEAHYQFNMYVDEFDIDIVNDKIKNGEVEIPEDESV